MSEGEKDALDALLEGTSLGTPAARRLRQRTPEGQAELARRLADSANSAADGESALYAAVYREVTGHLRSGRAEHPSGHDTTSRPSWSFRVELEPMARAVEILNTALSDFGDERDTSTDRLPSGREPLTAELFADTMRDLRAETVDLYERLRTTLRLYSSVETRISQGLSRILTADKSQFHQDRHPSPAGWDLRGSSEHQAGTLREIAERLERLEAALVSSRGVLEETWAGDAATAALGRIDAVVEHAQRVRGTVHDMQETLLMVDEAFSAAEITYRIAISSATANPQRPETYSHDGIVEHSRNLEQELDLEVARVWTAP